MAKSGQYIPHRSQPEHLSGATTCGGWYPLELYAELKARTFVGQNSTQNPQALQRSTTIETEPRAMDSPFGGTRSFGLKGGWVEESGSIGHPPTFLAFSGLTPQLEVIMVT